MIEVFQTLRYFVLYPIIVGSALVWSVLMLLRWQRKRVFTDFWAAQIGLAIGTWASLSVLALWIADHTGFSGTTSALITLGAVLVASALSMSAALLVWRLWRRNGE